MNLAFHSARILPIFKNTSIPSRSNFNRNASAQALKLLVFFNRKFNNLRYPLQKDYHRVAASHPWLDISSILDFHSSNRLRLPITFATIQALRTRGFEYMSCCRTERQKFPFHEQQTASQMMHPHQDCPLQIPRVPVDILKSTFQNQNV